MSDALFHDTLWQMTPGERSAILGLLDLVRPALAIEVGTAEGGCLRQIAARAGEVHSFDLVPPMIDRLGDHVHLHTGDSHELLPGVLDRFAAEGRNVDFALVDGDHSSDGVRRDVQNLLASPAVGETVIVAHDTGNERVRAGLDAVPYDAYPKVAHVDLDFVPGYMGRDKFTGELWGGLALIIVAADRAAYGSAGAVQSDRHHGGQMLSVARDVIGGRPPDGTAGRHDPRARQLSDAYAHIDVLEQRRADADRARARFAELEAEIGRQRSIAEHHRALVEALMSSPSWRVSAPLRSAKRVVGRLRGR